MKRIYLILAAAVLIVGGKVLADGTNNVLAKPAWLTDCSIGIKESYDNNVFLSGVSPQYLPASYTVPAGSVAALKDRSSWITSVSPKIGFNFAPLIGNTNFQTLSLAYAPDLVAYHEQPTENYTAHRVLAAAKIKTEPVTFSADDNFVYVDGSGMGPVYPGALYSAFATTADRERRRQIQDRANVSIQYDSEHFFVRPTASLLYYDLMTAQLDLAGYQNYADRADVNGGVDFGYKLTPKFAVTAGWRYGRQYQQQYAFSKYSSSSDYQRALFGVEGSPWKWLSVKIQSGPDFRSYDGNSATHTTPVGNRHPVRYYGEALATVIFAPENTLTFRYKLWEWVAGTGKVPYADGTYELNYHWQPAKKIAFDLGGKFSDWDYSSGNLPTCKRDDLFFDATAGVSYAVNNHVSISLSTSLDWGGNAKSGVTNPKNREFDRQLVSLGTQWKF
jgi:hypothetical protein